MAITGRCHCGAISYVAEGEAVYHSLCHCTDCRRWAGAPAVGWIAFKDQQLTVVGKPAIYHSSANATREFCSACGTGLFYRNPILLPGMIDIQSGTLDDPVNNAPSLHIMTKHKLPWMDNLNELPEFETYPGMDKVDA
ncbi:MAG: GFA family protein [Ottowia sp.]|nr:GFA family protein [Ottowia sp.]